MEKERVPLRVFVTKWEKEKRSVCPKFFTETFMCL